MNAVAILHKNKQYYKNNKWTVNKVRDEIEAGLALLNLLDRKAVTFFGSHRLAKEHPYYQHAKTTAQELGKSGYAIITGGGPGVMHAANSGAIEAGAPSVGLRAQLLEGERVTDPVFSYELDFHFLFTRRFIMSIKSEALIFYPGGYGTLNELFEYVVLMQTGIVDTLPIICVNKAYWEGLFKWMEEHPRKEDFLIHGVKDLKLLHFADTTEEVLKIVQKE